MRNALLGGIIIGVLVVNWIGVFILPVLIAIYQCIALFFLTKRKGLNQKNLKEIYEKFQYNYNDIKSEKFAGINIYIIQFGWTYITTTGIATFAYLIKIILIKY